LVHFTLFQMNGDQFPDIPREHFSTSFDMSLRFDQQSLVCSRFPGARTAARRLRCTHMNTSWTNTSGRRRINLIQTYSAVDVPNLHIYCRKFARSRCINNGNQSFNNLGIILGPFASLPGATGNSALAGFLDTGCLPMPACQHQGSRPHRARQIWCFARLMNPLPYGTTNCPATVAS
jgi:hypothetical protein